MRSRLGRLPGPVAEAPSRGDSGWLGIGSGSRARGDQPALPNNVGGSDTRGSRRTRLDALHELITALEGDHSHLNKTVEALGEEIAGMHKTILSLQDDVQSVTDRLPDSSKGPLEKARDVLTGGSE